MRSGAPASDAPRSPPAFLALCPGRRRAALRGSARAAAAAPRATSGASDAAADRRQAPDGRCSVKRWRIAWRSSGDMFRHMSRRCSGGSRRSISSRCSGDSRSHMSRRWSGRESLPGALALVLRARAAPGLALLGRHALPHVAPLLRGQAQPLARDRRRGRERRPGERDHERAREQRASVRRRRGRRCSGSMDGNAGRVARRQ